MASSRKNAEDCLWCVIKSTTRNNLQASVGRYSSENLWRSSQDMPEILKISNIVYLNILIIGALPLDDQQLPSGKLRT